MMRCWLLGPKRWYNHSQDWYSLAQCLFWQGYSALLRGGWSVPLRDVTHKGVHQMITKMLYFTNISRMGDYSDEIDEYEWLTAEDDHKNKFVYSERAVIGDLRKMQKYEKIWSDNTKNLWNNED